MKDVRWNNLKSERIKKSRGVSFEEIVKSKLIGIFQHPTRANQQLLLYEYKNYIWVAPCVEEADYFFIKTLFPSRKYTKLYKGAKK